MIHTNKFFNKMSASVNSYIIFVACVISWSLLDSTHAKYVKHKKVYKICRLDDDCFNICNNVKHHERTLDTFVATCLKGECFCSRHSIYAHFAVSSRKNKPPERRHHIRPYRRHHIAHFCPNLDIARNCIRTCMPLGKPAFCGKDHVCYCGHWYEHSKDVPVDVDDVYAQYRDLYEKYFGPNVNDLRQTEGDTSSVEEDSESAAVSNESEDIEESPRSDMTAYKLILAPRYAIR